MVVGVQKITASDPAFKAIGQIDAVLSEMGDEILFFYFIEIDKIERLICLRVKKSTGQCRGQPRFERCHHDSGIQIARSQYRTKTCQMEAIRLQTTKAEMRDRHKLGP